MRTTDQKPRAVASQRDQEQQMVIAGDDVLDAQLDEIEPARRHGTVTSIVTFRDGSSKLTCRFAVGRPQISQRSIMLAQKRAPVLGNLERPCETSQVNSISIVARVSLAPVPPIRTRPSGSAHCRVRPKVFGGVFGNSLRRRAIAVDRRREQFGGSVGISGSTTDSA